MVLYGGSVALLKCWRCWRRRLEAPQSLNDECVGIYIQFISVWCGAESRCRNNVFVWVNNRIVLVCVCVASYFFFFLIGFVIYSIYKLRECVVWRVPEKSRQGDGNHLPSIPIRYFFFFLHSPGLPYSFNISMVHRKVAWKHTEKLWVERTKKQLIDSFVEFYSLNSGSISFNLAMSRCFQNCNTISWLKWKRCIELLKIQ